MNSRWQSNKIGLINFWYYDNQEFSFIKGRMLLRGSNGSGKSVTMQSVIPLLLDGNMNPERLDPFGSRDRKMSSYLLEDDDGLDERTGYLYIEFKRQDNETYLTIGMGIRARRGKNLDKWYFALTDGRRIGKDFFLYKDMGEKVTLSKKELANRIGDGGRVIERQADYMEYVNKQLFGFETADEYKELLDLLIQLRTPKLSKDFKPSVINDILSDSLQALSDEDLRPMSEAIENMDTMNMNLKSRKEAKQAAEKIDAVFGRYNRKVLYEKADRLERVKSGLKATTTELREKERNLSECLLNIEELEAKLQEMDAKKDSLEKERESLGKSDAVTLKTREAELEEELRECRKNLEEKQGLIETKEEQYKDAQIRIGEEEDRKYEKEKELKELMHEMQLDAETMAFEEHGFMEAELTQNMERPYEFRTHQNQFNRTKEKIDEGTAILAETDNMERRKGELLKLRDTHVRELDTLQRKAAESENVLLQTQDEWKEALNRWNGRNREMVLEKELLRELGMFADTYGEDSDFADVRRKVADVWIGNRTKIESGIAVKTDEIAAAELEIADIRKELEEWENLKEPQPERSEAVARNRQRLDKLNIPYREFYKVIEFESELDEETCDRLEESLSRMGILDAVIVGEQYKDQVLKTEKECEDNYLFAGDSSAGNSLLDVLMLNEDVNDLFSNRQLTDILGSIAYDSEDITSVSKEGTYRMGVLTGTVTGEYEAGFIGTKARERRRLAKIKECTSKIDILEKRLRQLETEKSMLVERRENLQSEYETLPHDADMHEALRMLLAIENECERMKREISEVEERLKELVEVLDEKKRAALEIAESLYLGCSYEVFKKAKTAAENYGRHLVRAKAVHEMLLRSLEYLRDRKSRMKELDEDLKQIRYDVSLLLKDIRRKTEEEISIREQLKLTDYEEIKERLDHCVSWLADYPDMLAKCVGDKTRKEDKARRLDIEIVESRERIEAYEKDRAYFDSCYEMERQLGYVAIPSEIKDNAEHVRTYLETDAKDLVKDDIIRDLNRVYFENRGFLTDYQLMQDELFVDVDSTRGFNSTKEPNRNRVNDSDRKQNFDYDGFSAKRLDISARYQGVKISFSSLVKHLEEDIKELEELIRDGDRELFEDILANTVSRKIRGRINASNAWVQKMNELMNGMNTSSGLKLSLRWRSRTAENEEQLDTKELVELLKKDYRLMSENEAAKLSAHFRSKVDEARRNSRDSADMVSFYKIMKDTLDYRKWFEFRLFAQKSGERRKELTNSVFGTFSGGEKAMSMYVPLFSAVAAKYRGGREDAPRLISLDEAFAGVDNRNIRDMFRMMAEFQFDFIINSQVLWGDCDTLDALAIYQLIRPENAKFITVMPYLWNGNKKELLENEEQVERRGTEFGEPQRA